MPDLVFDMLVQDSAVLIVKGQMFAAHIPADIQATQMNPRTFQMMFRHSLGKYRLLLSPIPNLLIPGPHIT